MDGYLTEGFQAKKAAQVAAFFVNHGNNSMEKVRLMKLVYLAERAFIERHGAPMLYDELYSLQQGPVCFSTLELINGRIVSNWDAYVSLNCPTTDRKNVKADKIYTRDDLDELSNAEYAVLESIWKEFGHMTTEQIVDYTHKFCPEYTEVEQDRKSPIYYDDLFKILGFKDPDAHSEHIRQYRRVSTTLSAA